MNDQKDYNVFAGERFIESMRSSGYKDTSYAVAELVDNSIDAQAKHIYVVCIEKPNVATGRYALDKIAVLDDGHGMNVTELRSSLLFGDGTRGNNSSEIGKYGMGLPNSSLSQCKRVEVYSWKKLNGVHYTYLDVDDVRNGKKMIPLPRKNIMPVDLIHATRRKLKGSGTMVVWSKLDRCSWVTGRKIKEHSEFLIGRIYRRFLEKKIITINIITCQVDEGGNEVNRSVTKMLPNDPMYLMSPSSTPGEWGKKPMFQKDTNWEETYPIEYDDKIHEIKVRYSIEKSELRPPEKGDQGSTEHGKHAAKNTGVSIMRAGREIVLDTSLGTTSDSRDRWCGTEIEIPTTLDHVIGLTNNKQQVDGLQSIMRTIGRFSNDDSERDKSTEEFSNQSDVQSQLFRMMRNVSARIRSMQRRIRVRRTNTRKKGGKSKLGQKITGGIKADQEAGRTTQSDKDREKMSKDQRTDVIIKVLTSDGYDLKSAHDLATRWVKNDERVVFEIDELEGTNFFSSQSVGGLLRVKINTKHAAYKNLVMLTDQDRYKELTDKERLELAKDGISLLLTSWARFENFIEDDNQKKLVQDIRYQWGRELDVFLTQNIA